MNPGIGVPEMIVVLILALVVVGPEQLPVLMRKIGRIAGQARMMAREFQRSFDEIGRETELADLREEIEALKRANPIEQVRGEVDKIALEAQNDQIRQMKISKADPDIYADQKKTLHAEKPIAAKPAPDEAD